MKRHIRASLIAVAALALAGSPAAAQSAQSAHTNSPPVEVKRDGAAATQALTTEAASRLGITRAEARDDAKAPAMQSEGQMVRWIVIGAVVLLALVVVLAIAD